MSLFPGIASVCPAVTLQPSGTEEPTTMQRRSKRLPRHKAPGGCRVLIQRQSQGSSRLSLRCLPAAPSDLYRQLSLLITRVRPVAPLKPWFVWGGVLHASSHSPPRRSAARMSRRMVRRWQSQKVRMTLLVFQNVQQQRCRAESKNWRLFKHCCSRFSQTVQAVLFI